MGEWDPGPDGAKISARGNGYHFAGRIAPDLSHKCGLHRPGYNRSQASPNPAGWHVHGAAQNRRANVVHGHRVLDAPSFSPHHRDGVAPSPLLSLLLLNRRLPLGIRLNCDRSVLHGPGHESFRRILHTEYVRELKILDPLPLEIL
jgi:hypothetical protein